MIRRAHNKALRYFVALIIVSSTAGCALVGSLSTPYQPIGYRGGYAANNLQENLVEVSFSGNAHTSKRQVKDFALLRAAEVSLELGGSYFIVVKDEIDDDSKLISNGYVVDERKQYSSYLSIRVLKEKPIDEDRLVYNALEIQSNLRAKWEIEIEETEGSE